MTTLRWIVFGILGGAIYSWLVTISFARTFAVAWPEWYRAFFEGQPGLGVLLWNIAMGLPALVLALLVGFILVNVVRNAALSAAIVGAVVSFLYVVSTSSGNGWMHVSTFIVVGLLPLSAFVLELHNKPFKPDTGDAGAP